MALNVVVKVTNDCNLGCRYPCYYYRAVKRDSAIMAHEVISLLFTQVNEFKNLSKLSITWHGGEPLLAGLSWFEKALSMQEKVFSDSKTIVENSIQTNGVLLSDSWARFFLEKGFQVGLSIDGPTHDFFRCTRQGDPTLESALCALRTLQQHEVMCGALAVLTKKSTDCANSLLAFMLDNGIQSFDVLPNMQYLGDGKLTRYSITGNEYARFMIELYEAWLETDRQDVEIRTIDQMVGSLLGVPPNLCLFCRGCEGVLSLDTNGDLYPCDEFVGKPEFLLGNIRNNSIADVLESEAYRKFVAKSFQLPEACLRCEFVTLCGGNCTKFKFSSHRSSCNGRKQIFLYLKRSLKERGYL